MARFLAFVRRVISSQIACLPLYYGRLGNNQTGTDQRKYSEDSSILLVVSHLNSLPPPHYRKKKMKTSFYSESELADLGLKSFGDDVLISRHCSLYGVENISIGSHVRIDDFCILSGDIQLGDYSRVASYSALYGKYGIEIGTFSTLSSRCTLFSATDDYSGDCLVGPTIPEQYRHLKTGKILIGKMVNIGAGCVIMPSVSIEDGVSIGALSFVNHNLQAWNIWINRRQEISILRPRSQQMIKLATELENE